MCGVRRRFCPRIFFFPYIETEFRCNRGVVKNMEIWRKKTAKMKKEREKKVFFLFIPKNCAKIDSSPFSCRSDFCRLRELLDSKGRIDASYLDPPYKVLTRFTWMSLSQMRAWHDPAQNVNMKARHSFVSMNIDEWDRKKKTVRT